MFWLELGFFVVCGFFFVSSRGARGEGQFLIFVLCSVRHPTVHLYDDKVSIIVVEVLTTVLKYCNTRNWFLCNTTASFTLFNYYSTVHSFTGVSGPLVFQSCCLLNFLISLTSSSHPLT